MTILNRGGAMWRSAPGRGHWKQCDTKTGSPTLTPGASVTLTVPQGISQGLKQRMNRGACMAIGIRLRGSIAADNAIGATVTFAQKQQIGARFKFLVNNSFNQPYFQRTATLAELHTVGQIVNQPVTQLSREFNYDQSIGLATPFRGRLPKRFIITDTASSGMTATGAFDPVRFPGENDNRDSFWNALEDRILIRTTAPTTSVMDLLFVMPMCAYQFGAERDSLPLELLSNPDKPWTVQVQYFRDAAASLIGFDGGSLTLSAVDLFAYVIPQRDSDPVFIGRPWYVRYETFSAPYRLQSGEVPLFVGNTPAYESSEVDTVDARGYVPAVEYPNINPDFAINNQIQWFDSDGVSRFPYDQDDLNPRRVYTDAWNTGDARPPILTGLSTEMSIFSARALTGGRGYTTDVLPSLADILGPVSTAPVRVFSCVARDVNGAVGLASQDASCNRPYVQWAGSFAFNTTDVSSFQNITVVGLNNSPKDEALLKDMAANCCNRPNMRWKRQLIAPNAQAELVGELLSGWEQDMSLEKATNLLDAANAPNRAVDTKA